MEKCLFLILDVTFFLEEQKQELSGKGLRRANENKSCYECPKTV